MTNIKALTEEKNNLLEKMEAITKIAETRALTDEEKKEFTALELRARTIKVELTQEDKEELDKEQGGKEMIKDREVRAIDNVILPGEKFEVRGVAKDKNEQDVKLGNLVKGMAGLGWGGDHVSQEYYRAMQSGQNKTVIPTTLAGKIVDFARNKSAVLGHIPVVAMENNNLTVAVQNKDAKAYWVQEGEAITESDVAFKGVNLEGKTLAIFLPITEQLLESASNLESQIVNSCASALAVALDEAILYGTGADGQIKGMTTYGGINTVQYDPANAAQKNYDLIIKGSREIVKANLNPTNVALNVGLAGDLLMTKTSDGFYIEAPRAVTEHIWNESNNVKANEGIVYDKEQLLLGIHKNMTIEWGHINDQFQRIIKGLRIVMRCDLAVLNEKAITHIKSN